MPKIPIGWRPFTERPGGNIFSMFYGIMVVNNRQASGHVFSISTKSAGDRVLYRITAFFMAVLMILAVPGEASAARKKQNESYNPKYASIVVDSETGAILSQRYADKTVHPASLTKVMTLLLLFDAMERGEVRVSDRIMISQRANNAAPSKLGLAAGSSIRVEDAILAMVTKSANDISIAVAEHLGGSESRFAERMTQRARSIGMTHTTYRNAHGLHDARQVTTARDQAMLARYVIARYPNYYRYFSTKQFTYRGKTYTNHNRLMSSYAGMDGFKTGFINASGFNLIASAKRNNHRLIGVVFGGRSWKSRNDHMASLLNTAFAKDLSGTQYAGAKMPEIAPAAVAQAPMPIPAPKPVFATITSAAPGTIETTPGTSFTSLDSLSNKDTQIVVEKAQPEAAPVDVTGEAIKTVQSAINSGEYSEVTGQGDYDIATTRRIEAGLLTAAVYKGEAKYHRVAANTGNAVRDPAQNLSAQLQQQGNVQPASLPPQQQGDLWTVQIGAYTSRVATDDALRRAMTKLPPSLAHASPIVVPLKSGEGILFRGRLGNLTQAQAVEACRYFRDCLPVAPR